MSVYVKDWHEALQSWLQHHPKTMPDRLRLLREEFVRKFPIENIANMTLDQYAVGRPNSFCYWLEFKTKELGSISGGTAAKFGVWWSKSEDRWRWNSAYKDVGHALTCMKYGILALLDKASAQQFDELDQIGKKLLGANRYSLRGKPIYLYFPEDFLPISNPEHLRSFLRQLGAKPEGDLLALNRQLLALMRSYTQFDRFDTYQMMAFLYDEMLVKEDRGEPIPDEVKPPNESDAIIPYISNRTKVFISYSQEDADDLARLQVHLRAAKLSKAVTVEWWDATQIKPGAQWHEEIKSAIASTSVAILLISVDYLASEYIFENELPPLLAASEAEGVTILPVVLGACGFKHTKIAAFQAVNNPAHPLSRMPRHEKDEIWNKVIEVILNSDNPQ